MLRLFKKKNENARQTLLQPLFPKPRPGNKHALLYALPVPQVHFLQRQRTQIEANIKAEKKSHL